MANKTPRPERADVSWIDPALIRVNEEFNVRKDYGDIISLAESIAEEGVRIPLTIAPSEEPGFYDVVDGFRRMRAIEYLRENDRLEADSRVRAIITEKNYSTQRRVLDMITLNSGKPLEGYEEAEVYQRLRNWGYSESRIAKLVGKTTTHISNILKINNVSPSVRQALEDRALSTTQAIELERSGLDESEVDAAIKVAWDMARAKGKSRITKSLLEKAGTFKSAEHKPIRHRKAPETNIHLIFSEVSHQIERAIETGAEVDMDAYNLFLEWKDLLLSGEDANAIARTILLNADVAPEVEAGNVDTGIEQD